MQGRGSNHQTGIIDLGALAHPDTKDEHLAGIIMLALANAEAYRSVVDDETVEEAFVLGHSRALASFIALTTGGMVTVPEDVLMQTAYMAYVDVRGQLWVSAMASILTPPEDGSLDFDTDLVVAYLTARKATEVAEASMANIRDKCAAIVNREAEAQAMSARLMMDPRAMRGSS